MRPLALLIVDDNPSDRELAVQELRRHLVGNLLEQAETAEEAWLRLRDSTRPPVDLVLLDAHLPGRSGAELAADVAGEPALAHVRVVLLAALPPAGPDLPDGVHASVAKPLRIEALLKALKRLGGYEVVLGAT